MVIVVFFFLYGTWYIGYLFWIWCSASIPDLNYKLCNTSVTGCVSLGAPLNALSLPRKMSIFSYGCWIPKPLQGFLNGIIAQESRSLALNTFMYEEFKCCQLFPKWFDVRLIMDFCVSLHPHFMLHFGEQKTPYYIFVSTSDNSSFIFFSICVSGTQVFSDTFGLFWFPSYLFNWFFVFGGFKWDSVIFLVLF